MGLVPGVSLAQWIGTRLAARSLTYAASFWSSGTQPTGRHTPAAERHPAQPEHDKDIDLESGKGITPAAAYVASTKNALGLEGL